LCPNVDSERGSKSTGQKSHKKIISRSQNLNRPEQPVTKIVEYMYATHKNTFYWVLDDPVTLTRDLWLLAEVIFRQKTSCTHFPVSCIYNSWTWSFMFSFIILSWPYYSIYYALYYYASIVRLELCVRSRRSTDRQTNRQTIKCFLGLKLADCVYCQRNTSNIIGLIASSQTILYILIYDFSA